MLVASAHRVNARAPCWEACCSPFFRKLRAIDGHAPPDIRVTFVASVLLPDGACAS